MDGDINDLVVLANKDPGRVYRLANPNDRIAGVQHLQRLGYTIEPQRKDGPRIEGGDIVADGSYVSWMGDVLMSAPVETEQRHAAKARDVANHYSRAIGQRGGVDAIAVDGVAASWHGTDEYIERVRT